jgi:hypothetical protein
MLWDALPRAGDVANSQAMPRIAAVTLALAALLLAGCHTCGGSYNGTMTGYTSNWDNAGIVIVPAPDGIQTTVSRVPHGGCGSGADLFCQEGLVAECTDVCVALDTLSDDAGQSSYVLVTVRMAGRPPTTTIALPDPKVEVTFIVQGGPEDGIYTATNGHVITKTTQNNFVVEVDATAVTPLGETIALQGGRYARVNGHTETICVNE